MVRISCSFQPLFMDFSANRAPRKKVRKKSNIYQFPQDLYSLQFKLSSQQKCGNIVFHKRCKDRTVMSAYLSCTRRVLAPRWMSQFIPREKTPCVWKLEQNLGEYSSFTQTSRKMPEWQTGRAAAKWVYINEAHLIWGWSERNIYCPFSCHRVSCLGRFFWH